MTTKNIIMKKILLIMIVMMAFSWQAILAQKTCVIASAEDHVPIREALIHTNNNHWARTDYRGYWTMRYQFDSATVSKPGYIKATIRYKELPDTVFLLPEAKQIGEVTVWGKNQEHIKGMLDGIQQQINETPTSPTGFGFDAFGWMDKQGRRDRKHLKEAKKIFKNMDKKDPIVSAYEQATGKKYELQSPYSSGQVKQDSSLVEKKQDSAFVEKNQNSSLLEEKQEPSAKGNESEEKMNKLNAESAKNPEKDIEKEKMAE